MSFSALFYPKAIAIVGASRKVRTVGNDLVKNLVTQGYQGGIYPVNPSADVLYGKKVYPSVADLPEQIDLVVIAVPAAAVIEVLNAAADKGATAAVVISAGFKEIGNLDLEKQLAQVCRDRGILLIGPNCLGVLNAEIHMNASFAATMPVAGNIAFVSQSGALCTAVLDYAKELGLGFSKFVSIGNKADTNELKLIEYLATDPKTEVIALYIEQLTDATKLIEVIKNTTQGQHPKPVLVIKAGKTAEGATAVASHTGSLSGGDGAYTALFNQSGAIRAASISELFEFAKIFSKNHLQKLENIAIVTNAGGPGVLSTDEVIENGLHLAKFLPETTEALKKILPPAASVKNPVDVLGDAVSERYEQALTLIEKDPNVEGLIVVLTPQSMTEIEKTAHTIINLQHNSKKPVAVSFMGSEVVAPGVKLMKEAGVVTTDFPEQAARGMAAFGRFYTWSQQHKGSVKVFSDVNKAKVAEIFAAAKARGQTKFPEADSLAIFEAYGFPVLKHVMVRSSLEAKIALRADDGKYALKVISPDILHKTEVGGVVLNVTAENADQKFTELMETVKLKQPSAKIDGALLMEMAPKGGMEFIVGVSKAPALGTMVMFGLGGIYVEVLKDVAFAFAPMTDLDASRIVMSLRAAAFFKGVRGQAALDIPALVDIVCRMSQFVLDFPEIVELDINPLFGLPIGKGAKVSDGRIVIE